MEIDRKQSRSDRIRIAVDRLICTMRAHHRVIERRMENQNVHLSQHRMLLKLSRMGRTTSQKDLASAMGVTAACVARTVKSLCAAGLIEKSEGEDNRRREVSLLPKGQQLVDDSVNAFRRINEDVFEGLTDDEIQHLTDIVTRIHQNLTRMEREDGEVEGSEAEA